MKDHALRLHLEAHTRLGQTVSPGRELSLLRSRQGLQVASPPPDGVGLKKRSAVLYDEESVLAARAVVASTFDPSGDTS
jgi:hypothetical protein